MAGFGALRLVLETFVGKSVPGGRSATLANPAKSSTSRCLVRGFNANRAAITRIKRKEYTRKYPTLLVKPDGSTITIKYHEPRHIIKLPVVFEECSPEKQKKIRLLRQPKTEVDAREDITTSFDPLKYL